MSDELEGAWKEPIRGDQVGPWCVDLLEALLTGDTEKGRVQAGRIASLNDPDAILGLGYVATMMMLQLKNFLPPDEADGRMALMLANTRSSQGASGT